MPKDDLFIAMIKEEFNQFSHGFLFQQKKWLREGEFEKAATYSLRQIRIFGVFVIFSIIIFSLLSVYHFIQYGNSANLTNLILGLSSWAFVIFSTIYYTRDILVRKRSMLRVLKLLEARKEYLNQKNQNEEKGE
ncbi:MAG: hypothetical protein JJU37_02450 [Balneolaceae bacterium]|nr:hypothetical protein [Balneolaceae bacterium]